MGQKESPFDSRFISASPNDPGEIHHSGGSFRVAALPCRLGFSPSNSSSTSFFVLDIVLFLYKNLVGGAFVIFYFAVSVGVDGIWRRHFW